MSARAGAGGAGVAEQERWMRRCLALARRAEGRTAPNPLVGCVVVGARGEVLAEGWHRKAGEPHAEADALGHLGGRAPGATLYVNLEPCAHGGARRTAPCAPLVAAAGVRRVVIGMRDPIAAHSGGAAALVAAGIEVVEPVLAEECAELNRAFVTWAQKRRPWIVAKAAMTLDGKAATAGGESKWITGAQARAEGHRLRDQLDVVMVGVGTVLADDPRLTVRAIKDGRDPARVVVDSRLRTPTTAALLPAHAGGPARVVVATTAEAPAARERKLLAAGAEVWRLPAAGGRVSLPALARRLAKEGWTSALVEGGPTLHAALLAGGLIDELALFCAPLVLGEGARGWVGGDGAGRLADAPRFDLWGSPRRLGDDLLLRLRPRR